MRFARSATRHRISRDRIRHVIAHHRIRFEERPPAGSEAARSTRIVYLGEDAHGSAPEVMAIERDDGEQLVIHAMPLREKYRERYEESTR